MNNNNNKIIIIIIIIIKLIIIKIIIIKIITLISKNTYTFLFILIHEHYIVPKKVKFLQLCVLKVVD